DIGDRYLAAATIWSRAHQGLERLESFRDPMMVPGVDGALFLVHRALEVAQGADVVERVDIASDDLRERSRPRSRNRVLRQERRVGMGLVEIVDDRERLN